MTINLPHKAPATSDTERPVPRWALRAAYALPWLLLPSCLWRLPFAFHFEMGQLSDAPVSPLWVTIPYVFGLSVLTELAGLLSIGLVRRWGEVVPGWIPVIGGRRVPPMAAVVPAVAGGLVLTVVSVWMVLTWVGVSGRMAYENGWWQALAMVCITPLALWGPIVLALAYAYCRRRRHA
ncbi:hypothetical protein [Nonomuraea gerenzanensis]|uniref:Uncharacterized protein n=1 Tax=Nonomuraea gerenzanensis TaxID=93944 RepID=A0A1M4EMI9_9ACTN|nr:hypothetical protein [Nonomuraea gerenzanensis]UBU11562.1 hypothetical protein LCN96_45850 [Nonomuraea gerenzanensis]SBP00059.1 hypothetical protein BN4615_P9575 [Nonomuraea gerenzanensis]